MGRPPKHLGPAGHHAPHLQPRQSLRQLPAGPALPPAYRSAALRPSICRHPNAARLRSTHRMTATLRLVTPMLGLGLLEWLPLRGSSGGEAEVKGLDGRGVVCVSQRGERRGGVFSPVSLWGMGVELTPLLSLPAFVLLKRLYRGIQLVVASCCCGCEGPRNFNIGHNSLPFDLGSLSADVRGYWDDEAVTEA